MTDSKNNEKFMGFLSYADGHDENSLPQAVKAFITEGEMDLTQRRKRTLYIAALASNIAMHAFNGLEEASRKYEGGLEDQIFELRRMKPFHKELSDLTSAANYEVMTNQSMMRKLFSALTELTWNTMWDMDTRGKTRDEYREEVRAVQAEFDELMVDLMGGPGDIDELNEKLIVLDDRLGEMDRAWRRMKRK